MNYIEVELQLNPFRPFNEILIAELSELAFESFVEDEASSILKAYIPDEQFSLEPVKECCSRFNGMLDVQIKHRFIEKENWNKKWEENFDSVEVGSFCYVRAPFHERKEKFRYEIIIEPKMSFGTGHHETTQMMIELMEHLDLEGKKVLDMGSGTGILAILSMKMGAASVDAIDIEEWAYENMTENFKRNEVVANPYLGDADVINNLGSNYDLLLANINKNTLMNQFSTYNSVLKKGGKLLLSGFFKSDVTAILAAPSLSNYQLEKKRSKQNWCALSLVKI